MTSRYVHWGGGGAYLHHGYWDTVLIPPSLLYGIYYIKDYNFSCPFPVITHLSSFETSVFRFVSDPQSKDEEINTED